MVEELDEQIISKMQSGDHAAFRLILDRHLSQLMAYASRMTNSAMDAEDIVQETFFRLWTLRNRYDPKKSKLSTWLHRIAHNLCVDNYRLAAVRSTKNYTGLEHQHDEGPLVNLEIQLQSKEVAHALMQLNLQQRSALVLFHYQGLSHRAISTVLDLSSDAVESLLRRSRKKMRENLRM